MRLPYFFSLVLTLIERRKAYMHPLSNAFAYGEWLTSLMGLVLIISIILLLLVVLRHKRSEHHLKQEIAKLTTINMELRQEIEKLNQEQVDILEDIIDADLPNKEIQGFNPQEMKALSELAKRLS